MKFNQIFGTVFGLLLTVTAAPLAKSISSCTKFLPGNSLERSIVGSLERNLGKRSAKSSKLDLVIPHPSPNLAHVSSGNLGHTSSAKVVHTTNDVASIMTALPVEAIDFLMAVLPVNRTVNSTAGLSGFFSGFQSGVNRTVLSNVAKAKSYGFPTSQHVMNASSLFASSRNSSVGAFGLFPLKTNITHGMGSGLNSTVHSNPFLAFNGTTDLFAHLISAFSALAPLNSPSFNVTPMAALNATFAPVFNFNGLHALNMNETLNSLRHLPIFSSTQLDSEHLKRHWMSLSRYLSFNGTRSKVDKRL